MNTVQLSTAPAGVHIFVSPINDGGEKPVKELVIDGRTIKLGDEFTPTRYWCGRNHRLLEEGWEYLVERKGEKVWVTEPVRDDEVLETRKTPAPVMAKARVARAKLMAAVASEDHKQLGEALGLFLDDVPAKKEERLVAAKTLLATK